MKKGICTGVAKTVLTTSAMILFTSSLVMGSGQMAEDPDVSGEVLSGENEDSSVKFSIGVGAGYLTGEATELVYWPQVNNHKASELIWKIDSLYMANLNGTIDFGTDWFLKADAWFKVTDGSGTMDDYDWMSPGSDWTHWSHHDDTDVTKGSMIDISGGWRFLNSEKFTLTGLVGYKYDNFNWEAYGGSYTYSVNGFRDSSGDFTDGEPGIGYEQTVWSLYAGLGVDLELSEMFSVEGRFIYSPFVQGEAVDHHYMRNLITYDEFENGDMFSFDIKAVINFTEQMALDVGYAYTVYDEMQGDSEWHFNDEGVVQLAPDGAGMDLQHSLLSVTFRYAF